MVAYSSAAGQRVVLFRAGLLHGTWSGWGVHTTIMGLYFRPDLCGATVEETSVRYPVDDVAPDGLSDHR
jgi:hypothetical protein